MTLVHTVLMILTTLFGPALRHGMSGFGGYLVANGLATHDGVSAIIGGAGAAGSVLLSLVDKRIKSEKAKRDAEEQMRQLELELRRGPG